MIKKLFIKIARILNYELIDQNKFISPTLNSEINDIIREEQEIRWFKSNITFKSIFNKFGFTE